MNTTNQNISPDITTLPAEVQGLTHRELVELFRRLNGGTAGFDTGRYKKAELLTVAAAWLAQGVPASIMQGHAAAVINERAAQAAATARPLPAAPVAALPLPPAPAPAAEPSGVVTLPPMVNIDAPPGPQSDSIRESILAAIALTTPAPQPAPGLLPHQAAAVAALPLQA